MDALQRTPADARFLYVLAHGAGAGMRHPFMETIAELLAGQGVATYRYEFPYMRDGRRRPDPPGVLKETVSQAVERARASADACAVLAGGKSLGARMTSLAAAEGTLPGVSGLVFLGFPLHAPGKPGIGRAEHLDDIALPMLFIQGTRDSLADAGLMQDVCERLGSKATLHFVEGGDHSFKVLKRSGRQRDDVMLEIAETISNWSCRNFSRAES
ncbi:MAG: alpha/beta family hydrolase [Candidatus Krumholzibacteria bacterium]